MKESGICPKCKGQDIVKIPGKVKDYGSGNNIQVGMTVLSAVPVHRYVCCSCGFTEEWVDLKDVPKIKKHYR
ncbi:hypothetical protein LQU94_05075 [Peptoniphilus sp. KCTC 25270]|uniref:hypothetical protein n=1 Tax=Peptoniphilus sp. KCTC 25270 TaxID=2897414 RepID=UPI001E64FFA5|nr:hypothetical protein [Peptoniphilus sp. KCTC 25270]MCD1147481.1 hypothetical protein [Peptoniphilus sp. KCTC 25270]